MGLTGLMWWIDRWRKSTAYMDMTLEEQGAYRNLLDEAWLRGGALPNDERVLGRACGDVTAWKKVRAGVLVHFDLVDGVYRNKTLDDVLHQSTRRVKKQKRYRDKARNGPGNAAGNEGGNGPGNGGGNEQGNAGGNNPGNEPGYLDPDPDQERSTEQERSRRGRARGFTGKRLKVSQAQHQVVLDALGASAAALDLMALYAVWDAELVASGETFDALPYIKARAAAGVVGPARNPPREPEVDWFEECKQLHSGECGGRLRHHNRMAIDAEKARMDERKRA